MSHTHIIKPDHDIAISSHYYFYIFTSCFFHYIGFKLFFIIFFTSLLCWTVLLKRTCELSLAEKNTCWATIPMPEKRKLKQYNIPSLCQDFFPLQTMLQKSHGAPHSQSKSNSLIDNVGKEVNKKSHAHFKPLRNTGQKKNKVNQSLPSGKEQTSRDWSSTFSF